MSTDLVTCLRAVHADTMSRLVGLLDIDASIHTPEWRRLHQCPPDLACPECNPDELRARMSTDLVAKLEDLIKQATTERSHYYVAATAGEAVREIKRLRLELFNAHNSRPICNCADCRMHRGPR